ncbi:ankyrin repeat and SOCS box protein 16 [Eudromia elegans]
MAQESFAFSAPALRSLRLQRELLEREERRRALAREAATRRLLPPAPPRPPARPPRCRDPAAQHALYAGDLPRVRSIFGDESAANAVVETVTEELRWEPELGLWVLSPRARQTSPLRVAAGRGHRDCARHLVLRGAAVDAVVGGRAALHDCVAGGHLRCAQLLLAFGADPDVLGDDGLAPLHLCTEPRSLPCAELLLSHGARVNLASRERGLTALHVAARHGLEAHVELYLRHGAEPGRRSGDGETALNAACAAAERAADAERYCRVARRLLAAGADPRAAGRKAHTPLHNACGNGQPALARLLLRHGARAAAANGAGDTPLDCALHAVQEQRGAQPERTIALLLDHGAGPVHPKMLRLCCRCPRALEVLLNACERVPPAEAWAPAVPPELWQEHAAFYESARRAAGRPRRLQHLARCALRRHLGARCHAALPALPLPPALRRYLQLHGEGLIA